MSALKLPRKSGSKKLRVGVVVTYAAKDIEVSQEMMAQADGSDQFSAADLGDRRPADERVRALRAGAHRRSRAAITAIA